MQKNKENPVLRYVLPRLRSVGIAACLGLAVGWGLLPVAANAQFGFDLGLPSLGADGDDDPVTLDAQFTPATADRPAVLMLTATVEEGWHVYSVTQPQGGPLRTQIRLKPSDDYRLIGEFAATPGFEAHSYPDVWPGVEVQEHNGAVTWYAPIELLGGAAADAVTVEGSVRLQACKDSCIPLSFDFAAKRGDGVPIGPLSVGAELASSPPAPEAPQQAAPGATAQQDASPPAGLGEAAFTPAATSYDLSKVQLGEEKTLGFVLLLAMVGGLVLNLMPCVLPVIGLKVMSFVAQAGKSRLQAFALNLWYSLGIMTVFWVLAVLAITVGYRWGDQAGNPVFNVLMATLVMAMGLSLLGVWEIPIPGFLGSNTTQMAASKEGAFGAWLKGVVTTLLAIPCTGPGMAVALGWAVGKPAPLIALIFSAIGLGMASPYLVVGAFPGLVKFLPKPGAWMETFKQLMGFVLMGTVVFLLSLLPMQFVIPTLALLTAVGLACWVFASTPITASPADKWQAYALCGAILLGGGVLSFGWLEPQVVRPRLAAEVETAANSLLAEQLKVDGGAGTLSVVAPLSLAGADNGAWQPFSLSRLESVAVQERRTVLVDFSAEWCFTCKTLEQAVLHTEPVEQAIASAGVVTMYADYTDYPPEIKTTLDALESNGVPVIAIFPGDDPYHPIVFRGGYTQTQLIDAIAEAAGGPVEKVAANN